MEIIESYYIYAIENIENGKVYVGVTTNLSDRKTGHFTKLRNERHSNSYLQNSWNKYGEDAFRFFILEKVEGTKHTASEREIKWINGIDSLFDKHGYNIELGGYKGRVNEDTIKKIRKKVVENQGRKILQYNLNGEFIKEWESISKAERETNISLQNIRSCLKGKSRRAGQYIWRYYVDDYPLKIKKHSKKLLSLQKKIIQYDLDGNFIKVWNCIGDASEKYTGYRRSGNITSAIKRKGTCFNYQWRYFTEDYPENIGKSKKQLTKKVAKYSLNNEFICTYDSMIEGAKDVGLTSEVGISSVCKGKCKTAGGFKWGWV